MLHAPPTPSPSLISDNDAGSRIKQPDGKT
jgi:hypothetical protein